VSSTPTPHPVQASAPDIARRFGLIVAAIAALVAHRFLRDPRLMPLIIPLWTRLTRTARRFERLMARVATNRLRMPRPTRPGTTRPRPSTPDTARPPTLPTGHAWLIRAIPYEAAAYGCQLEALLAEQATVDLLAACPQATRILRPLCHMLGLAAFPRKRRAPKPRPEPTPRPAKPPNPFAKPLHPGPDYRPSAKWPRGPWPKRRSPSSWLTARQRGETPA
jgi:hypothetical protein